MTHMTNKQLADISLFQSLGQGTQQDTKKTAFDPFAANKEIAVQNVCITLDALSRLAPDQELVSLVGILKKLGTLTAADAALNKFSVGSIREVVDALVFGLGGRQEVARLGGKVSAGNQAPKTGAPRAAAAPTAGQKPMSGPATTPANNPPAVAKMAAAKPLSKGDIKQEYSEARKEYRKLRKLRERNPNSVTVERDFLKALERFEKATDAFNRM